MFIIAVFSVVELLVACSIGFAALAYVTQLVLDATGRSRTSKMLRQENEDLIRRNKELDTDVSLLRREVDKLESDVKFLQSQVADLSQRDQKAVLDALGLHEIHAEERATRTLTLLAEIRDALTTST